LYILGYVCLLYIFFAEVTAHIFCLFLKWIIYFIIILNSYMFWISDLLYQVCFTNIFSQSMTCLFILLTEWKLLVKFDLPFFFFFESCFGAASKKSPANSRSARFSSMLLS
jgi:hypothetical protein